LQALDYWIRIKWHLERQEFAHRGFFPDHRILAIPPKMILVAPALHFHPTTETILRYFSPSVDVERIGVGMDWRRQLQVAFRLVGSQPPAMFEGESNL
jgi:hypothetical protein